MIRAKLLSGVFFPALVISAVLLTGCENDLKDLQKISDAEVNKPVERYTDVDVIYSDSAKVKAHMTAPLMLDYNSRNEKVDTSKSAQKPYTEMPKGVKVIFYDANLEENCTITADYAIRYPIEKRIELHKNVVGTNAKGERFTSDELIWDEATKQIRSDKMVHVVMHDGTVLDGVNFESDQSLNHWKFGQAKGDIHVNSQDISH